MSDETTLLLDPDREEKGAMAPNPASVVLRFPIVCNSKTNYARIIALLMEEGTALIRAQVLQHLQRESLEATLADNQKKLEKLRKDNILSHLQYQVVLGSLSFFLSYFFLSFFGILSSCPSSNHSCYCFFLRLL